MTRIEFAPEVADDIDRIIDHLLQHEVSGAASRIQDIVRAIDVLERNPLIGRPMDALKRELVIGRHARGYIAVYVYVTDTAFVLALRSQSEAGYARP